VTSRWQNPQMGASGRQPRKESEDAKRLALKALSGNGLFLLGFLEAGLQTPSLSASSHFVFLLSIFHEINETRILSANSALFGEMLRISVNGRAEMSE